MAHFSDPWFHIGNIIAFTKGWHPCKRTLHLVSSITCTILSDNLIYLNVSFVCAAFSTILHEHKFYVQYRSNEIKQIKQFDHLKYYKLSTRQKMKWTDGVFIITEGCLEQPPHTTDIYNTRCRKRANCFMKHSTHPVLAPFVPLPSGRRLWSIWSRTTRLRNSYFPTAVRLLNSGCVI